MSRFSNQTLALSPDSLAKPLIGLLAGILVVSTCFAQIGPKTRSAKDAKADNFSEYGIPAKLDTGTSKKRKRISRLSRSKEDDSPLIDRASTELIIHSADHSPSPLGGAATVYSRVSALPDPVERPSFELEMAVQPYEPQGQAQIQGTDSVALNSPGLRPMPMLEFRWLPIRLTHLPEYEFGVFASVGYTQHALDIRAPTGVALEDTKLNTTKVQLGLVTSWQKTLLSKWALRGEVGLGQLNATQVSNSSFANGSASVAYATLGGFFDYQVWDKFAVSVGYERHQPTTSESPNLLVPRSNFVVGLSGGFQ